MKIITCLIFVLFGIVVNLAKAGDVRLQPKPNQFANLISFGYSDVDAQAMISGSRDDLWALVPSKGWSNETYQLKSKMYSALPSGGFDDPMANVIINMCKASARDPRHCVIFASAVACAESSCAATWVAASHGNNIFGMTTPNSFVSRTAATRDWINKYNDYWFTANEGFHYSYCKGPYYCGVGADYDVYGFYSNIPNKPPVFNYCLSEKQPDGSLLNYCKNGYASAKTAYLRLR